jgi:hypothetical protein
MNTTTERISAKDFLAMQTAGTGRKKQPAAKTEPSESDIQATLVQALRQCGYEVLETGSQRAGLVGKIYAGLCQAGMLHHSLSKQAIYTVLNRAIRGFSENDAGLPDVLITHPDWPVGEWLGLELKTPTGKVRPEQQRLSDAGRVVIVRGVAEGLLEVCEAERRIAKATAIDEDETWRQAVARGCKLASFSGQFQEVK